MASCVLASVVSSVNGGGSADRPVSNPARSVDWWSVTRREPSRLVLRGQDWFFGEGWLGFEIREFDLVVIGALRTKGAPGFLYWKFLRPLHHRIFVGLARHRAARAERPSWSSRRPAYLRYQ